MPTEQAQEFLWQFSAIQAITIPVSRPRWLEVAIMNLDLTDVRRMSGSLLLEEAVTKPGTLHEAYSRFWNYSLGNQILALIQCRDRGIEPGPLASFNRWKELGRHVKKGERAITLCMPIKLKCKDWDQRREEAGMIEGDEVHGAGFRTVFVFKRNWFVLSQTDGEQYKPEPMPKWNKEQALAALDIREEPFKLIDGNSQGYATAARTIAISPLAVLPWKTTFHEVAHLLLGHIGEGRLADDEVPEKSLREVEAESVALICCESLGLEGAEFCRGYIQSWLSGHGIPENSAQRIMKAATAILKAGVVADQVDIDTNQGVGDTA
ncbi:MAG: DUF1738 domain-containing protein [Acidobacteria bacterium]|nr:DUF1738 domain-containing protein [Acidobacteriota bacterium]